MENDEKTRIFKSAFVSESPLVLLALPRKASKRLIVLARVSELFEFDRIYTEREVNAVLAPVFSDITLLRRELIEAKLLARERDGSRYWRCKENAL